MFYLMDTTTGTSHTVRLDSDTIFPWISMYAGYLYDIIECILGLLLVCIAVLVIFVLLKQLALFDITE